MRGGRLPDRRSSSVAAVRPTWVTLPLLGGSGSGQAAAFPRKRALESARKRRRLNLVIRLQQARFGRSSYHTNLLADSAVQQAADLGGRVDTSWR
jgi:hypothetical protein